MNVHTDILIFVEDPGAVNCTIGLLEPLRAMDVNTTIYAMGTSIEYMAGKGAIFTELPNEINPIILLDTVSPTLVLIGTSENPDTLGLKLITPAKERGIPTVGIVDGPANAQHRFRGSGSSALHLAPDFIIVPNTHLADIFIEMGHPKSNVLVGGNPYYDNVKTERIALHAEGQNSVRKRVFPDAPDGTPIIVFAAEISDGLNPSQFYRSNEYTLHGQASRNLRTEVVLDEFLDCLSGQMPKPYLSLRLHPKNSREEFSNYLPHFNQISDTGSPTDICYAADLVVGMTSILLMEAAILGRPTLSIIPRECEKDWLESIGLGITQVAISREQAHHEMDKFIKTWPKTTDNQVDKMINFGSSDRISRFLKDTVKSMSN